MATGSPALQRVAPSATNAAEAAVFEITSSGRLCVVTVQDGRDHHEDHRVWIAGYVLDPIDYQLMGALPGDFCNYWNTETDTGYIGGHSVVFLGWDRDRHGEIRGLHYIVMQYVDDPNGSQGRAAAVANEAGNVVGIMPHPERASEPDLGSIDGRVLWDSLLSLVMA